MEKKNDATPKRLVISKLVMTMLYLLPDDNDRWDLISSLDAYGQGYTVMEDGLANKVKEAYDYLTDPLREDHVFIDDLQIFE